MTMNTRAYMQVLALGALLLASGACSKKSPTSPAGLSDSLSPETRAGISSVHAALASPVWQGLDALAAAPGPAHDAAAVRALLESSASGVGVIGASPMPVSLVSGVSAGLTRGASQPSATIIPPDQRGTTWVYDASQLRYVIDPARSGAPANGVRYILYAVNPLDHTVLAEAEIGYADLTDEGDSTANAVSLRLRAVSHDVVFVEYQVGLAGSAEAAAVQVNGTFFDGTRHLTFALQAHGAHTPAAESQEVRARLAVPEAAFELTSTARASADLAHGTQHFEHAIDIDGHVFAILADGAAEAARATVAVDGTPFAQVNVNGSTTVILGADGQPLPAAQREALGQLFGLFDQVSAALTRLLEPVGVLFGLVPRA
jgi:hypothetical protein